MKKIVIIDGGPRKNFNTAAMLQKFAEGAKSAGEGIEVKTVRLYDLDYKGCMSCMACKIKGKASSLAASRRRPSAATATSIGRRTCSGPSRQESGWRKN